VSESPTWKRVHALFQQALELDPPEREALLATVAADDPALGREVRSLLSAHAEATGFLSHPPAPDDVDAVSPGEKLGPYRVVEEIGRGGMGVVYRAVRDDEAFTKDVAIKLIYPGMRSQEISKRFRAERQILAMLDHPHICKLIDGGTTPDGSPFLVMDYVVGKPLLEYCDGHRLGIDRRLDLFLAVCDAVQFAHQRLVIHRDLKPDNILVTEDGAPRLLDFGIARLVSPETGGLPTTVTAPMSRLLTPDYASPEQVRGDPVTVAGDVYSLGVILYELLSGRRPLRFTTRTPEEILRVVGTQEPAAPSATLARSPAADAATRRGETTQRLRRRLAGDLDYIVLRALEKDPARRYASVDHLAQDIRRHRDGLPVLARGRSTTYLVSRFVRRHRAAVVAGTLVALALIAGLAGTAWQAGVAGRERDRANRRFNEVKALAHAVVFDIHDDIVDLPGSTKARETLVKHALQYLNSLSDEVTGDFALEHELAVAYAKIGDVQGRPMFPNLGRSAEALESYDKALAILRRISDAEPDSLGAARDLIVTTQRRSDLLHVMGRREEAMSEALAARQRIVSEMERHPNEPLLKGDLLLSYDRLSDMKLAAADTQGAIDDRRLGASLAEEYFREDPGDPNRRRGVLIACTKAGNLLAARGDRAGALASYRRAEALARESVAALPRNTEARRDLSIVYGMIGLFLARGGEVDSGLVAYDQGMKLCEEMAAEDPANVLFQSDLAAGHFEIGTILMDGRRYEAAEARFGEAFRRFAALVVADSANHENRLSLARSGRRAGDACLAMSKREAPNALRSPWRARAASWFEKSLDVYKRLERDDGSPGEDAVESAEMARALAALKASG
jgi:non-specific serine/threonine protein kinase/serine/threonine-protein kinase